MNDALFPGAADLGFRGGAVRRARPRAGPRRPAAAVVSRTDRSVRAELVSGRGEDFWPWPRLLLAGRPMTFDALSTAFGRCDGPGCAPFDLTDGMLQTCLALPGRTRTRPARGFGASSRLDRSMSCRRPITDMVPTGHQPEGQASRFPFKTDDRYQAASLLLRCSAPLEIAWRPNARQCLSNSTITAPRCFGSSRAGTTRHCGNPCLPLASVSWDS